MSLTPGWNSGLHILAVASGATDDTCVGFAAGAIVGWVLRLLRSGRYRGAQQKS